MSKYIEVPYTNRLNCKDPGWYRDLDGNKALVIYNELALLKWKYHDHFNYYVDGLGVDREEFKRQLAVRKTPLYKAIYE